MLEESIQELESRSLARIASAATADELEAVRVDALGRKGGLTQFSKEMGKLAPEERKRARHAAERRPAEAGRGARIAQGAVRGSGPARAAGRRMGGPHAARARTAPRPSAPDHAHPAGTGRALRLARIRGAGRSRSRDRISQFRRPEHPARPSGARHAGHVLAGRRQPAAHAHFAGAGPRHGAARPAAAHDRAGPRISQRERGRLARAHVLPARRHDDRPRRLGGAPAVFHEDAAHRDFPSRRHRAAASGVFSVRRAGLRARYPMPDLRRSGLPGLQAERLGGTAAVRPGESERAAA